MIKNYFSTFIYQRQNLVSPVLILKIITGIIFLFSSLQVKAQVEKSIIEDQFDTYRERNLQEKIFVHTDKNLYLSGEICWFKIYNVDAYFHKSINLGKVAYIEILDKNNSPVLQGKIDLQHGAGDGSFYLPAKLVSGNYHLRAYTNWMKNFGTDYFFEKKLSIINVQNGQPENVLVKKMPPEMSFFPEGGNLVNGIKSKVGFRISNQYGKGIYCDGVIVDEKGDTITAFHPLKFGIGSFSFTPLQGSIYKAIIKLPDGDQQEKELPAAYSYGYAMHLENNGKGQIIITVQTPDKGNSPAASVYLFVHTRNVTKAVMTGMLKNGEARFLIDDSKPGEGISHFTVFNENRQPVCERLYFKKPLHNLQITAAADKAVYDVRKKINLQISSAAGAGKYVAANMSMAVYRIDSLTSVDEQDISAYLLLSADLSGIVESPEYYLLNNNDTVLEAANNLMLTQGWRRFKWEDILSNKKPRFNFLPEINGHIINGKIIPLKPGLPVENIPAYLSVPGIRTQFQTATSVEHGLIKFEMKHFYNDGEIIVQTNSEKDSLYKVEIDLPFYNGYSQSNLAPFNEFINNDGLLKRYIATQVQNTFLFNRINQISTLNFDTTAFYLKPDAMYLLDNYVRFTTLEEVFREYVPGVNVRQRNGKYQLPVFDDNNKLPFETDPLALVDGVPVFNFNKLLTYDPLKIRKLEVVNRTYYLGGNTFDGIINLTSYKGDVTGAEIDPHATIIDYEGLQLQRDFYSPVYETNEQLDSHLPDFRNLLYWSPKIITGATGKTQAVFYSSDVSGKYAIVIQGISEDGTAGSKVVFFEVKKD